MAHRGFVDFELETRGVAPHAPRPDLGVDKIVKMGHVFVALEQFDERLQAGRRIRLRTRVGARALIEGGQELSSFPARCLQTGERRTIPGETAADVERELGDLAADATVRLIASRDPTRRPSTTRSSSSSLASAAAGAPSGRRSEQTRR